MTINEKQELVKLLNIYMAELLKLNDRNIEERKANKNKWEGNYILVKSLYEHARIISTKLSREINKEIKSYWEL